MLELLQWLGFSVLTGVAISFAVRAKRDPRCEEDFVYHNLPTSIACSGVARVLVTSLIEGRLWVAFQTHLHQADVILRLATLASLAVFIGLYICTVVFLLPHLLVITLPRLRKRLVKARDQGLSALACMPVSTKFLLWLSGLQVAILLLILTVIVLRPEQQFTACTLLFTGLGIVMGMGFGIAVVNLSGIYCNGVIGNKSQPNPVETTAKKSSPSKFKIPTLDDAIACFDIFIRIICLLGFFYFAPYLMFIKPLLVYFKVIPS